MPNTIRTIAQVAPGTPCVGTYDGPTELIGVPFVPVAMWSDLGLGDPDHRHLIHVTTATGDQVWFAPGDAVTT